MVNRVALDTSVIIEYIDENSKYRDQAKAVFSAILSGFLEALVPHPVLVEAFYVSARIYREVGLEDYMDRAVSLVEWLYRHPFITVLDGGLHMALRAGEIKLEYGLALTDCYVLAASKIYGCKALFRKPEREILKRIDLLRKNFEIIFLSDYA